MRPLGRLLELPKGEQNGTQNGPKSNAKFNIKQEGFEDPLGSVLGLSWVVWGVDLGVKNHQISLVLQGFRENSVFEKDEAWKCILDGSWVNFDAKQGPKRIPNRSLGASWARLGAS